ncbi:P-loop NTPase fold protein [Pseudomonas silesiensis]|uniref:P-loop NTPase fold protein n=1 Tax=Pseudomonas silesiensis TaxID=1853130 RepID=UPI0034D3B0E9
MSVIQVKKALQHFAVNKEGRAIVLKGEWGTGKTFIWRQTIESHKASFSRTSYSYVSLFGLSSLSDLKRAIFTNIVQREKAGEVATTASIIDNLSQFDFSDAKGWFRKLSSQTKDVKIPIIGGIGGMVDSIQFSTISDTLICIDDFERRSNSLSARDVLGLISNLVESRNCSVILILNENSLEDDDEFFAFNEKVFDYEVVYKPEVEECVNIVFPASDESHKLLARNIIKLEINNIRLLKKIRLFNNMLSPHLKNAPAEIKDKAMLILPLAILAIYGEGKCPVSVDFLTDPLSLNYSPNLYSISAEDKAKHDAHMVKIHWLRNYGFSGANDLDAAIISLVERGYADEDELEVLLVALEDSIQHVKDMNLLSEAWTALNGSFGDDQTYVVEMFDRALDVCIHKMNLRDIEQVYWLYSSLGQSERANEILQIHFEDAKKKGWYFSRKAVRPWPQEPAVSAALEAYIDNNVLDVSIDELMDMAYRNDFMPSVIKEFAKKTQEDFHHYFLNANHPYVHSYARKCLELANTQYSDAESNRGVKHIFMCTYIALQRLSERSLLNKIRATRFKEYDPTYQLFRAEGDEQGKWS